MKFRVFFPAVVLVAAFAVILVAGRHAVDAQARLQFAVLPLAAEEASGSDELAVELHENFLTAGDLIPEAQVAAVLESRDGRLDFNPRIDEARALGAALGCDFYVMGRVSSARRSGGDRSTYFDVRVALFGVDARTGGLAAWESIVGEGPSPEQALASARKALRGKIGPFVERLRTFRRERVAEAGTLTDVPAIDARSGEFPEDVTPPTFTKRPRPETTEAARDADIDARIEAEFILTADGKVAAVTIVRWAGYGLEDAVREAIRGYVFKPATRDGKPVSVRVLAEYRFRRS